MLCDFKPQIPNHSHIPPQVDALELHGNTKNISAPQNWGNIIIYNTAIYACSCHAQWQQALNLLNDLRHQEIQQDATTCSAAILSCHSKHLNDLELQQLSCHGFLFVATLKKNMKVNY